MTKLLAWVVVAVMAATSCTPLANIIWPTTVKCLASPSAELVAKVRAIVEQDGLDAVFSAATVKALEGLARQYGPEVIVCVLHDLIEAYTAPTGLQAPPDHMAAARRSQAFLNDREVDVRQ
jgi:hypothetical protein